MLQRVQTIYLFVAISAVIATFFFPFGTLNVSGEIYSLTPYGIKGPTEAYKDVNSYMVFIPMTLTIVACALALLNFADRKRQMRFLRFGFLLFAVTFALIALYINASSKVAMEGVALSTGVGLFTPLVGVIMCWLAARAIRKDEELVRSVDRIR